MQRAHEHKGESSSNLVHFAQHLQKQISEIKAEDETLQATLKALSESLSGIVGAEEKYVATKEAHRKAMSLLPQLKQIEETTHTQILNELTEKVSQLEKQLTATKAPTGEDILAELKNLQDEYNTLKQEAAAAIKASPRIRAQLQASMEDADKRLQACTQWQDDLTKQLAAQQKQHEETISELQTILSQTKAALTKRLAELEKRVGSLEDKHHKLESRVDPRFTVAEKLLKLRHYVLENAFITDELKYYVPPNGESKAGSGDYQPLREWVQSEILESKAEAHVLLLEGEAGAGKSTFNRFLLRQLWQDAAWNNFKPGETPPSAYIPFFIPLGSLHVEPQHLLGYLKQLPELATGFTDSEINVLKTDYRLLLIADGYDELRGQQAINLYETNQFAQQEGRIKLLIGCRSQHAQTLKIDEVFAPTKTALFKRRHVSPFTKSQIEMYLKKYVEKNSSTSWDVARYEAELAKLPELQTFLATPFMLLMSMTLLPRLAASHESKTTETKEAPTHSLTRLSLYDAFMDHWFEREAAKALQAGDSTPPKQLVELYRQFCLKFAEGLKLTGLTSVQYPYGEEALFGDDLFAERPKTVVDPKGPRGPWVKSLFGDHEAFARARKGAPLLIAPGNHHRFIHASLFDYFLATTLSQRFRMITTDKAEESAMEILNELLTQPLTRDQLGWLLDRLKQNKKLEADVWSYLNEECRGSIFICLLVEGLEQVQKEREESALKNQGPLGIRLLEQLQLNETLQEEISDQQFTLGEKEMQIAQLKREQEKSEQERTEAKALITKLQLQLQEKEAKLIEIQAQLKSKQDKSQGLTSRLSFFANKEEQAKAARKALEVKTTAERKAPEEKEVPTFLKLVADGKQDEAEALLKTKPGLALCYSEVKDIGGRTFKRITAFQYAVWALDWHMWTMLLKYLPEEQAAQQFLELETKGTEHGKAFDLQPLIQALQTYTDKYGSWNDKQKQEHWCKVVGGQQRLLPMHVWHEYCRRDRSFRPCPSFKEASLPRDVSDWLVKGGSLVSNLSASWAAGRGFMATSTHISGRGNLVEACSDIDMVALSALSKCRTEQREILASTFKTGQSLQGEHKAFVKKA